MTTGGAGSFPTEVPDATDDPHDATEADNEPIGSNAPVPQTTDATNMDILPTLPQPSNTKDTPADAPMETVGRIIVERVQLNAGVAPTVQRVFVCCSAGWLQSKYFSKGSDAGDDAENLLELLETPDSVGITHHGLEFDIGKDGLCFG